MILAHIQITYMYNNIYSHYDKNVAYNMQTSQYPLTLNLSVVAEHIRI